MGIENVKIADYQGKKNVVIFFYPKSFTPGCNRENRGFAKDYDKFTSLNTEVIGVSADEVETQDKFSCDFGLPFVLLSDKESKAAKAFEVGRDMFGLIPSRVTFVINKDGKIVARHHSALKMQSHVDEALKAVQEIEKTAN